MIFKVFVSDWRIVLFLLALLCLFAVLSARGCAVEVEWLTDWLYGHCLSAFSCTHLLACRNVSLPHCCVHNKQTPFISDVNHSSQAHHKSASVACVCNCVFLRRYYLVLIILLVEVQLAWTSLLCCDVVFTGIVIWLVCCGFAEYHAAYFLSVVQHTLVYMMK